MSLLPAPTGHRRPHFPTLQFSVFLTPLRGPPGPPCRAHGEKLGQPGNYSRTWGWPCTPSPPPRCLSRGGVREKGGPGRQGPTHALAGAHARPRVGERGLKPPPPAAVSPAQRVGVNGEGEEHPPPLQLSSHGVSPSRPATPAAAAEQSAGGSRPASRLLVGGCPCVSLGGMAAAAVAAGPFNRWAATGSPLGLFAVAAATPPRARSTATTPATADCHRGLPLPLPPSLHPTGARVCTAVAVVGAHPAWHPPPLFCCPVPPPPPSGLLRCCRRLA